MNWEAIGAVGQVVGAIGVFFTLVYLAYQIKQNTIQLEQSTISARAAAQTASNTTLRENRQSIYQTSEMAFIYETGSSDPTKLNSTELLRYRLLMANITEVMLEIYTQAFTTKFAPEIWDTQGKSLVARILSTPGGEWFWSCYQDNYPSSFRGAVNKILAGRCDDDDA